ncbi:hypothetical protein [Actinoplanes siamensis]|uniref:Uncharacterized protein n=1 Tax=Actinoplanes siamensis TaxID=1223317 RepID=A0A919NE16_9ACTN|nr:hypothetical protein [Actinoplanes siamensis]GIF08880.1 hypothetical protein Asi03nite_64180 [Actinoplanes siamensis]
MQIIPVQHPDGEAAHDVLTLDEAALRAVTDPWKRARLADELAAHLQQRFVAVLDVRRDAVHELVIQLGTARSRVARYLGLSATRIGQLLTSRTVSRAARTAKGGEVA